MRRALLLLLALSACHRPGSAGDSPPNTDDRCQVVEAGFGPEGTVPVRAEAVVTGLEVPWAIGFLPDGNWLVTERPGRVRLIRGGRELGETVISFASSRGEGGLLGLALHPQFGANRLFYLYRTAEDGTNQVERYRLGADDTSATLDRLVVGGIRGARFHDGGRIRFGPDGMLYVGTGDGTEPDRAQDRSSLNGKLLRLTPDGEVPSDNPFPGSPVFLLGIRNLEAFDWLEGRTLVLAEHGPSGELGRSGHDEVNVARGGDNLGWPTIYGCQRAAGMVSPALTWQKAVPPGGGALYTGTAIPEWRGSFLVGTLGSKHLHRVELAPGDPGRVARHEVYFQGDPPTGFGRLREVVMGPDGELYVTTSNCDGRGSCPPDKDRILRVFR